MTLLLTVCSLAIYARVAFGPPLPHPAAAFLLVPTAAWVIIAALVGTAEWSRRRAS